MDEKPSKRWYTRKCNENLRSFADGILESVVCNFTGNSLVSLYQEVPCDYKSPQNKFDHFFRIQRPVDVEEALLSLFHHDLQTAEFKKEMVSQYIRHNSSQNYIEDPKDV